MIELVEVFSTLGFYNYSCFSNKVFTIFVALLQTYFEHFRENQAPKKALYPLFCYNCFLFMILIICSSDTHWRSWQGLKGILTYVHVGPMWTMGNVQELWFYLKLRASMVLELFLSLPCYWALVPSFCLYFSCFHWLNHGNYLN